MSMALANEKNTDLAFDTSVLRRCGEDYSKIAEELRTMAQNLNKSLADLAASGWTTPAGTAFQKMAETNWESNIQKYADLLDTLRSILDAAAQDYDNLVSNHIETTYLHS